MAPARNVMDILYTSNLYPPAIGGSQILMHCLSKAISGMGHQVKVIALTSRYRDDWVRLSTIATEERRDYSYEGIRVSQIGCSGTCASTPATGAIAYYALMEPAVRAVSHQMLPFFESLPCFLPWCMNMKRQGIPRARLSIFRA